jgi:hypothetical protein
MVKSNSIPVGRKAHKKTSFSDQEYVNLVPNDDDVAVKDERRYLPIDVVERDLDRWSWGTENFTWQFYRDNHGQQGITASIVLVIPWTEFNGKAVQRRLTGSCNFTMANYAPNSHFLATAKSECVKNAASDLGPKFGRGLNDTHHDEGRQVEFEAPPTAAQRQKTKPDALMLAKFKKAAAEGDQTVLDILSNVYEFSDSDA